jgi:hypothetical protein
VTQACLAALSGGRRAPSGASLRLPLPLRGDASLGPAHPLRALSLETDDLTSRGPELAVLAPLSALRHLRLSCTDKTAERALGSLRVLQVGGAAGSGGARTCMWAYLRCPSSPHG